MFKLHSLVKLFFVALALGLIMFSYHFFTNEDGVKEENYANVTDLGASYKADKEIEEALKKLQEGNIELAEVLTHLNMEEIKSGLYYKDKIVKGAVFVAHMSDVAKFTPGALDVLLTLNEQRPDGDPRKFVVGRLSDYLVDEYRQDNRQLDLALERMRK